VSHQPERKEKNCLNCGTTVIGRYCHICGQENVETKESFWSLSKHFVFDILHFDGKFWHTLKCLVICPGGVARQYCEGKRNRYLHPIRMYLFTSAIFFLLFFALKGNELKISENSLSRKDRIALTNNLNQQLKNNPGRASLLRQLSLLNDSSKNVYPSQFDSSQGFGFSMANSGKYRSVEQYDSLQKKLPGKERDNPFTRMLTKRGIEFKQKYGNDMRQGFNLILSDFLHKVPYMLFLSLPFFALILKLLYVRRKNFYYSDHAIFTLYHYIFSFILLMLMIAIGQLQNWTGFSGLGWVLLLLVFVWMGYLLIEMKNFYRQAWFKTVIKFLLLDLLGFLVIMFLFIVFLLFTILAS
jgi:hypothetical protein